MPVLAVFGTAFLLGGRASEGPASVVGGERGERLVLIIVDSLRRATLEEPGVMPHLLAWSREPSQRTLDVHTCGANFTLPCVQTLLEGRESPFAAGLHNFTGQEGGAESLPAAAAAAGIPYAVISDQTLTSLYGRTAARSLDVEVWPGSHLDRDLRAIDEASAILAAGDIPIVLLHVPGTDKAAHIEKPGTDGYRDHYRQVDARIGALLAGLDPEHDAVIVTGDHGHNEEGHHVQESVAVLGGGPLVVLLGALDVPDRLEQVDLLLPLSWPLLLPLPASWEGRWPAGRGEVPERLRRFEELNRQAFAAAGFDAPTLPDALERARAARASRHLEGLLASLPALSVLLLWVLLFGGDVRRPWTVTLALAALAVALTAVSTPALGPWLAAPVLAGAIWLGVRAVGARRVLFVLAILGAAATLARLALPWSAFFHTRGGATWQTPVFFAAVVVAGGVLAVIRDGSLRRVGEGSLAFALLCLPSGVYYYQAGQNLLHPVAIGALVALLVSLAVRPRVTIRSLPPLRLAGPLARIFHRVQAASADARAPSRRAVICRPRQAASVPAGAKHPLAANSLAPRRSRSERGEICGLALVVATLPLLFLHEAGGWDYAFFTASWLGAAHPAWSITLWWALGAAMAWRADTTPLRLAVVALFALGHGYASVLMDLPLGWLVGALAPALFAAGWIALGPRGDLASSPEQRADADGLVTLGAALFAFWIVFKGFFFNHIDFTAALGWFGGLAAERWVFALAWLATCVKYAVPVLLVVVAVRIARGPAATQALLHRTLWTLNLKVLALLVAIQAGALAPQEKLWELAVSDLVFVAHVIVFVALGALLVRRLDRAPAAAPAPAPAARLAAG